MNIQSLRPYKGFGLFAVGVACITLITKCNDKMIINEKRQKIEAQDPLRYKRVLAQEEGKSLHQRASMWHKEYWDMQDSLKIDSIVQKAYFDGYNRAKDSIDNLK